MQRPASEGGPYKTGGARQPRRGSDPETFVELEAVFATVADVVVDEPENVESFQQIVVVVAELERTIHEEHGLHAVGVVGNESVSDAGTLADVTASFGNPIIFKIAPASFEGAGTDGAAVAMAAEHAALLDPQNVDVIVVADIKGQMADENIGLERDVGGFDL